MSTHGRVVSCRHVEDFTCGLDLISSSLCQATIVKGSSVELALVNHVLACCELALSSLHARLDKILSFAELTYPFRASMNNCEDPHDTHRCLRAKSKRERGREREREGERESFSWNFP
jgi:hypothetical protein